MPGLSGKSVLVTGGAGFIGSHFLERLAAGACAPGNLVAVDNLFLGKVDNLAAARTAFPALKFYEQDATDAAAARAHSAAGRVVTTWRGAAADLARAPSWTVGVNVALTTVLYELQRRGLFGR
jgi:UDP-glucose 4-epimerase